LLPLYGRERHTERQPSPDGTAPQIIFLGVYLATQALVMRLMARSRAMPPWTHVLLLLSKRIHSIYLLRLFNDCWAMLLAYAALDLLCSRLWAAAIVVFSAAVSIKMHVLLFAPGVLAVCVLVRPTALSDF
jgi:alpha-1,3-mannosyltransferase